MTNRITELIEKTTRLRKAATDGKWKSRTQASLAHRPRLVIQACHGALMTLVAEEVREPDAAFIAHMSTAAMELVEEVERLRAEVNEDSRCGKCGSEDIAGRCRKCGQEW